MLPDFPYVNSNKLLDIEVKNVNIKLFNSYFSIPKLYIDGNEKVELSKKHIIKIILNELKDIITIDDLIKFFIDKETNGLNIIETESVSLKDCFEHIKYISEKLSDAERKQIVKDNQVDKLKFKYKDLSVNLSIDSLKELDDYINKVI